MSARERRDLEDDDGGGRSSISRTRDDGLDDDPSTGASSGIGGSIPGAPSGGSGGGGRDDDDDRSRSRDRDDDDDRRRSDFRNDSRASRRVGGSGDPTASDTRTETFRADAGASQRVGGSGDPFAEPEPDTVDVGGAADSGAGPRVGISDQSPFTDVRATAQLDAQTETDLAVSDVQINDGTATLTPDAEFDERVARRENRPTSISRTRDDGLDDGGGTLDRLARSYTENIAAPFGDAVRDATPAAQIERRTTGTDALGTAVDATATGVAQLGNIPGAIAGARDTTQRLDRDLGRGTQDTTSVGPLSSTAIIPGAGTQAVARDFGSDAVRVGSAAASSPIETAGTLFGAAAGGVIGSRAAFGAARRARRSSTARSVDDMVVDTRIVSDGGRRRVDTVDQEAITIEQMADAAEDTIDDIEDIPGVERTSSGTRSADDLQTQRIEGAARLFDEADEASTSRTADVEDMTARQRADEQIPPAREFPDEATRQREVDALTERLRQQDADADAVARLRGSTATDATAGVFGATTAAAAEAQPSLGGREAVARPEDVFGVSATAGGLLADADTQQEAATQQEVGLQEQLGLQEEVGLQQSVGVQQDLAVQQPTRTTTTTTLAPPTTTTTRRPPTVEEDSSDDDEFFFGIESDGDVFASGVLSGSQAAARVFDDNR